MSSAPLPPPRPPREPLVRPGECDLHARDMTATFAADVPLGAAQQRLSELAQWLPIDGDPGTPLGTLVETNSTGPLRLGYGAWRDLLLGTQFTNGRGELITAGGRTVKNVAGYDLTKFMVGSRGVFGKVVTLTARTYRRPDGAVLARFAPDLATLSSLLPSPLRPQWAVLTADDLWCGYLGDETTVAYYRQHLPRAGPKDVAVRSVDEDIAHRGSLWRAEGAEGTETFRASVPPARVLDFVKAGGIDIWVADAAFGIVLGTVPRDGGRHVVRDAAHGTGGSVLLFTVSGRTEGPPNPSPLTDDPLTEAPPVNGPPPPPPFDVSTTPAERRIIERLKAAFDPDNRLTPLPWHPR